MSIFKFTTAYENGFQPTKWAKECSPGQSRGLDPCDALGYVPMAFQAMFIKAFMARKRGAT